MVSSSDLQKVHFYFGEILHFIRNVLVGIRLCKYLKWNVLKLVELVQEKDIEYPIFLYSSITSLCLLIFFTIRKIYLHYIHFTHVYVLIAFTSQLIFHTCVNYFSSYTA